MLQDLPSSITGPFAWVSERIGAEPLRIRLAFYVGLAAFVAATLAAIWSLVLRVAFEIEGARRKRVRKLWTELLLEALNGDLPALPKLRRWDRRTVVTRFNYLFETLSGDANDQLRRAAFAGGIDRDVIVMLKSRNAADQLTAIVAAGHIKVDEAAALVHRFIADPRPAQSLAAAEARVRIEAASALPAVLAEFARRRDWHTTRVLAVLDEAKSVIGGGLADVVRSSTAAERARVVELVAALRDAQAMDAVRELLAEDTAEPDVIAASLKAIAAARDPRDVTLVIAFADHPDHHVRTQAAVALGSLGSEDELPMLLRLAADNSSWVRHEATRALVKLPGMSGERLTAIHDELTDPAARAALRRVITELNSD